MISNRRSGAAMVALALFVLLAACVQMRLLVPLDLAVARGMEQIGGAWLDGWAILAGNLLAGEAAIVYGLVWAAVLWRRGAEWRSVAPLAFLLPTALEFGLKSVLHQPLVPHELQFHSPGVYLFNSFPSQGSFPSGHSIRAAFFCVFAAALLWGRGGKGRRGAAAGLVALAPLLAFSRLYVGWHWTSDVLAGLLLGGAVGLLAAAVLDMKVSWNYGGTDRAGEDVTAKTRRDEETRRDERVITR